MYDYPMNYCYQKVNAPAMKLRTRVAQGGEWPSAVVDIISPSGACQCYWWDGVPSDVVAQLSAGDRRMLAAVRQRWDAGLQGSSYDINKYWSSYD
jgi:hypothetical protein